MRSWSGRNYKNTNYYYFCTKGVGRIQRLHISFVDLRWEFPRLLLQHCGLPPPSPTPSHIRAQCVVFISALVLLVQGDSLLLLLMHVQLQKGFKPLSICYWRCCNISWEFLEFPQHWLRDVFNVIANSQLFFICFVRNSSLWNRYLESVWNLKTPRFKEIKWI